MAMERIKSVEQALSSYIRDELSPELDDILAKDPRFRLSNIIDSYGILLLVEWIERTYMFEVQIDDIVPENLDSIAAAAAYIVRMTPCG